MIPTAIGIVGAAILLVSDDWQAVAWSTGAVCAGTGRWARSEGNRSAAGNSSSSSACGFCHRTLRAVPSRYSGRSASKLLQPWCACAPKGKAPAAIST